ncbi:hypothetical protein D082_24090 [Synechocystis sp. PCC 6714]|nr:hypothetical protein D082_24090 [Synechocystis sp. PCC 6714]
MGSAMAVMQMRRKNKGGSSEAIAAGCQTGQLLPPSAYHGG